jgi:hypothetical protein
MRSTSRAQPPEDSTAPGVIPGTVHPRNEPTGERGSRLPPVPPAPAQPRATPAARRRRMRRGNRS